jgi:hypothetical protein
MELALGERGTPTATAARPWGFEEGMMGESPNWMVYNGKSHSDG